MKRKILILVLMLVAAGLASDVRAQSLTLRPLNAAGFVPGGGVEARGVNFRLGFHPTDGSITHLYNVTVQPGNVQCLVAQVDSFRLLFFLPANIPQGMSHIRIQGPYFIVFVPVTTQEVAPTVEARGTFAYTRPTTAFGEFVGTLTFPRGVGLMTVTFEAGGLGLGGDGWTLVIQNGPTNETSSAGWEYEAKAFPPSSATGIKGRISAPIGPPPTSGLYYVVIYKRLADGTISRSEARAIQFVVESEAP